MMTFFLNGNNPLNKSLKVGSVTNTQKNQALELMH